MLRSCAAAVCASATLLVTAIAGGAAGGFAPAPAARPGLAVRRLAAPRNSSGRGRVGHDAKAFGHKAGRIRRAPEVATARALVVGVSFAGSQPPPVPLSHFQSVFFGTGSGSVASYFKWASYGKFTFRGRLVGARAGGQAGDWLVVPHSIAYYAQGNSGMGDAKTPNATSGGDLLEQAVVRLLDKANFNWKPYEDASGGVPYLILLVDSPDAALTGANTDLWSFEESQADTPIVENGLQVSVVENYDVDAALGQGPGQLNGVGTFDHEFAHILGALDMYDTNNDIAGLADWSLMGSGNYNGPSDIGNDPSDLDAFTRLQFGWSAPTTISGPPVLYSLPPAETSPEVLEYPIPGSQQYYLMENRQPLGSDSWLPGHGLLIYRVDGAIMSPSSPAWINDCLECVTGAHKNPHPGIEIMQSDGSQSLIKAQSAGDSGSQGDPFPGQAGNTSFSDKTTPSAVGWGGVPSYLSVSGITQEPNGDVVMGAGSVAAKLSPTAVGAAGGTVTVTDPLAPFAQGDVVTLAGAPVSAVAGLTVRSPTRATFSVSSGTPPGAYLVQLTDSQNATTPLAYLVVTDSTATSGSPATSAAAAAPAALVVRAVKSAVAGASVTVTVRIVNTSGRQVTGNFGPIWVDGAPVATTNGTATAEVSSPRAGPLLVTAALYRLPSIVGRAPITVTPGPVADVRFIGPTSVVAGQTARYRVEAEDRYGNPVTAVLRLAGGQSVDLRDGLGEVRVRFLRAGDAEVAAAGPRLSAGSLTVHVRAGGPFRVNSTFTPPRPIVGQTIRITAVARDAYGNPAVGDLTLSHTTRPLKAGRATFTVAFGTTGEHVLYYRVPTHSSVRVDVRSRFSFPWL